MKQTREEILQEWEHVTEDYQHLRARLRKLVKEKKQLELKQKCQDYKYKVKWHVTLFTKQCIEEIASDDYLRFKMTDKGLPYLDRYEEKGYDYILLTTLDEYDEMDLLIKRINAVSDLNIARCRSEAKQIILGK